MRRVSEAQSRVTELRGQGPTIAGTHKYFIIRSFGLAWPGLAWPRSELACKTWPSTIEMIQFMHLPQTHTHTHTRACTPELLTWATLTVATAAFDYGYIT